MSDPSNFIITCCALGKIWFLLPLSYYVQVTDCQQQPTEDHRLAVSCLSGKPAARTICFRFLAEPRCAVKCMPFTRPSSRLLKLLVLQVKLSFPNSRGAIILMDLDFTTHIYPHTHNIQASFVKVVGKAVGKWNHHLHGVCKVCFMKHDNLRGSLVYVGLIEV